MAAATKKRGRPKKFEYIETVFPDKEPRAAQNIQYATLAISEFTEGRTDPFFVTDRGSIRRQGIAEQIGRMYADGTINEAEARELITTCKEEYANGRQVKEIEKTLRLLHNNLRTRGNHNSNNIE